MLILYILYPQIEEEEGILKFSEDRQMDTGKTICPRSINAEGIKRGNNSCKNEKLSPLFVHVPFLVVNIYFELKVYMFSNGRDMTKYYSSCTTTMPRLYQYLRFPPKTAK